MLAPSSLQSLYPPSCHANMVRIFPDCRRPCWRRLPRKAFVLRRVAPTPSGFSRLPGAHVGAVLPAKPLASVTSRQHGPDFPGSPALMLALSSPQSFVSSPGRANTIRIFPAHRCPCWRRPPCKAFRPPLGHANTVRIFPDCRCPCWRYPPRKAFGLRHVTPHGPDFPGSPALMLALSSLQSLCPPSGRANTVRIFPAHRRPGMKNLHPESNLSLTMRLFSDAGLFFC